MKRACRPAVIIALLLAPLVPPGRGEASPDLAVYNGTVSATAVHVQAGSNAFPNFASGIVDNRYPLAAAHQDSSPFSLAYSSPLDTGATGQTAAGTAQQRQPQYAEVRCPPQCDDQSVLVGSEPGPCASSQATEQKVTAGARAAGVSRGRSSGALVLDPDRAAALRTALSAWRDRFLTIDDALRHPIPTADTPDGFEGDAARSESRLDGSALVLTGDSAVGWVSLGSGAIMLRDVSVHVVVTNDGTPKKDVAIRIGAAEVGGTPVTIGPDGVSVKGQVLPGLAGNAEQATAALNQALGQAGVEVRSLAPAEQTADHQLTLDAVGVLIRLAPPSPAPGTPAQFTTLAVGEVFTDSLAVPGTAGGELDDGLPDALGGTAATEPFPPTDTVGATDRPGSFADQGTGTTLTADASIPGPATSISRRPASDSASPVTSEPLPVPAQANRAPAPNRLGAASQAVRLGAREKPTALLLLYFLWQSLILGTVASLWLWRKGAHR